MKRNRVNVKIYLACLSLIQSFIVRGFSHGMTYQYV